MYVKPNTARINTASWLFLTGKMFTDRMHTIIRTDYGHQTTVGSKQSAYSILLTLYYSWGNL